MKHPDERPEVPWVAGQTSVAVAWRGGTTWRERRAQLVLAGLGLFVLVADLWTRWSALALALPVTAAATAWSAMPWWTCVADEAGVGFTLSHRPWAPTPDARATAADAGTCIPWDDVQEVVPQANGVRILRRSAEPVDVPVPSERLRTALIDDLRARAAATPPAPDEGHRDRVIALVEGLEHAVRAQQAAATPDPLGWTDTPEGHLTLFRAPWQAGAWRWIPVAVVMGVATLAVGASPGIAGLVGLFALAGVLAVRQPWTAFEIRANGVRFETREGLLDARPRARPTGRLATRAAWVDVIGVAPTSDGLALQRDGASTVRVRVPEHLRRPLRDALAGHVARHRASVVDSPEASRAARAALGSLTGREP